MTMEPINEGTRLPGAVPLHGDIPIEAFNPLLRSLLTWDLVERVEDPESPGGHRWLLREEAQRRLDALAPRPREAASSLAYLDHWCARCREQKLTHLIEGRYLCTDCQRAESGEESASSPQPKRPRAGHDLLSRARLLPR
jgi:hypothetical protein